MPPTVTPFERLTQAAAHNRLAHAYLIVGPARGAAGALAERLIQWLACETATPPRPCGTCRPCHQVKARSWADATWLEPSSKSRQMDIDTIRQLIIKLSHGALAGGWKVGILQDADRLTPQAANALLKTLEEPPGQTLLLLLSEQPQNLLPTILSRCQRLMLGARHPELPEGLQATFMDWLRYSVRIDGPVDALGMAAELSTLLDQQRAEIESEVKKEATDDEKGAGSVADRAQLEARITSRYREIRGHMLEALALWHRDVLVLRAGAASEILSYPEEQELLRQRAGQLSLADALDAVEIVEGMRRQLERFLPENSVFGYGLDRLART